MLNYINLTFYFRESTVTKDTGSIYARLSVNQRRVTLGAVSSISGLPMPKAVSIERKQWDVEEERVRATHPLAGDLNKAIAIVRERVHKVHMQNEGFDIRVNAENFKLSVIGTTARALLSFPDLAAKFLTEREQTGSRASTVQTYEYKLRPLMDFLKVEKAYDKPAEDFSGAMLSRYKTYLITKRGNKPRAADKSCQVIKTVLIWGASNEFIRKNPLLYVRVRVDKTPNLTCLTQDEVQTLRRANLPDDLRKVADCFVFACFTGLAYHDMKALTPGNIQVTEGKRCLMGKRLKTDTEYCVPITPIAQELMTKYGGPHRFPLLGNQTYNRMLKLVMLAAGINKSISSHSARKTFCDWCINELGLTEEATIVAMGQKSTKELNPYRRTRTKRLLGEFPSELIDNSNAVPLASTCSPMATVGFSLFIRVI